jgi:DNA invertase Pin-like site-specific DNA recombinase
MGYWASQSWACKLPTLALFAGYARVSRVGDREDTLISPELQAERIAAYARTRGIEIDQHPPELDVSGSKRSRPILDGIIEAIERKEYAGIVVADIDRLSRMTLVDALHTIERIEQAGGEVVAIAQNFDVSTPEGRWARNLWLSTTRMQWERHQMQFRAAKRSAVERGIWPLPAPPTGYEVQARRHGGDGKLRPGKRAKDVRRIFELRAAGRSNSHIARRFDISPSTVHKIVTNRVYLGEINYAGFHHPAAHEPLVDRVLWEAAQLGHPRPSRKDNPPALLAGLVRCAGCQRKMTPNSTSGSPNYRCTPTNAAGRCPAPAMIARALIEPHVERTVLGHLAGIRYETTSAGGKLDQAAVELARAEAELTAYQQATSALEPEHFMAGMRSRIDAVTDARRALAEARLAAGPAPETGELLDRWPDLDMEQRRHVLRGALSVVWVRRGRGLDGRVRIIEAGHPVPAMTGTEAVPIVPVDWPDGDMPGEIRPLGP